MLKFATLAVLTLSSIRAALFNEDMTSALIAAKDTVTLKETFKKYEKEQDHGYLSWALANVANFQAHMPKVATCLGIAHDPFPEDNMCVSYLVHNTLIALSLNVLGKTEPFTIVITSLKPSDTKPLAAIRFWTLYREDAVEVLKSVMDKSPELIIDDLPSWIAFHFLDRNSSYYTLVREEAFEYLTSFATQGVLAKALSIVKKNEHYKIVYETGRTKVECCDSHDYFPQNLIDKIDALLGLMKARKALVDELAILPKVLVDLMLEYTACDIPPNCSKSTPETSVSVLGKGSSPLQSRTSRTSHKKSKQGQ